MTQETVVFRQVHPDFIPGGQLTSQAFFPFPKDLGKLSVYDGDQITARESFTHYTKVLRNTAASVWGVTCTEATEAGLMVAPDPLEDFPLHAVIDFTAHPEKSFRKLAKKLKAFALAGGCLYSPAS